MCWDCDDNPKGDPHKNYIRGGVEIDDFDKEVNYRPRKKNKKPKKKKGCPENDFGPHVYVWAPQIYKYPWWPEAGLDPFYKRFGYYRYEIKVCCGCEKTTGKSRYTEEFAKRVNKMGWFKATYGD